MKIQLAKMMFGALTMCAVLTLAAEAQTKGPIGTKAGFGPVKDVHGQAVKRPNPRENMAGYVDELARIEEALKTLEFAFKKAVANHDVKKARELQGILVDLKGRKQRVLDAMAETMAIAGTMAMMPPTGWTYEYFLALNRLEEIARKEGMDRAKFNALLKRLTGLMGA